MNNVQTKVGQHFEITVLDNSASTGHRWMLEQLPGCVMLEDVETVLPQGPMMPGRPVKRVFTFFADKAGNGTIRFGLVRLTVTPPQVVDQLAYLVHVDGGGIHPMPLYAAAIGDVIAKGDLAKMKELAASAEDYLAKGADIQGALAKLKAEITRLSQ